MKSIFIPKLFVVVLAVAVALGQLGCATRKDAPAPLAPAPTSKHVETVVKGHKDREHVQFVAAERINVIVDGSIYEAPVREQTRVIVAANTQASAEQIDALTAAYSSSVRALEARYAADQDAITALKKENQRLSDAEMRATASALRKWGVSFIVLGVAVAVALKAIPLGATVAAIGLLLVSAAQLYVRIASHAWYERTVAALIVAIVAALGWVVWHAYKNGTLTRKALRERDRMRSVLTELVPAVDLLKTEMGDKLAPWLKDLKGRMDWDDRRVVKTIRAETEAEA